MLPEALNGSNPMMPDGGLWLAAVADAPVMDPVPLLKRVKINASSRKKYINSKP